jgi:hypothetical protein
MPDGGSKISVEDASSGSGNEDGPTQDPVADEVQGQDQRPDSNARFRSAVREFIATCDALLELAQALRPHVDELDVRPSTQVLEQFMGARLKPEDRVAFRQAMDEAITRAVHGAARAEGPSDTDDSDAEQEVGRTRMRLTAKRVEQLEAFGRALRRELRESSAVRPKKRQLLYRSLLTSLIASLEVLIGNTVAAFYFANPDAMGSDEKEFSLADLKAMGSVDDAVDEAIARRTDAFMYQSTADWGRWFARTTKTDFSDIAIDWAITNEVIERRHVIVHNGGRVSKQYLIRTGLEGQTSVGSELPIDDDYLANAVDHILVFGVLVATTTWAHVIPDAGRGPGDQVQELTEALMTAKRWQAVDKLTLVSLSRLAQTEVQRYTFQFNRWLATKEMHGLDSVRAELEAFDDSALLPVFRFVRLALLEKYDEATAMVESLVDSNSISLSSLRDWPALAGLREHPPFAADLRDRLARERRRLARRRIELVGQKTSGDGAQAQPRAGARTRQRSPRRLASEPSKGRRTTRRRNPSNDG